jgi:membrane fusion protein (multidrug efflux system)
MSETIALNGRRKKVLYVIAALVAVLVVYGIFHTIQGFSRVTTDDAYLEGRVHTIAAKVPGTVKTIPVDDNRAVKKGDLLLELDPRDYEVKVNEASAALEAEKSRLADAEAGIQAAAANLEVQEVAFNQAGLDKKRTEALFKENVVSKERSEKVETAFNMAQAQVKAAKEQLAKAKSSRELEASLIKQREAGLEAAKLALGYTKVYAPGDGYVTKKAVQEGNQIAAGQPVMAVVALDDIWVTANYKETQLRSVKPGQKVTIEVDTYRGAAFSGTVDSIMAGTGSVFSLFPPENALGNYVKVVQRIPVKIVLDRNTDSRHVLRIGMSVVPTIHTNE